MTDYMHAQAQPHRTSDLDTLRAEVERLRAENAELRALGTELHDLAAWMSGSSDFDALGNFEEGAALLKRARAALAKGGGK